MLLLRTRSTLVSTSLNFQRQFFKCPAKFLTVVFPGYYQHVEVVFDLDWDRSNPLFQRFVPALPYPKRLISIEAASRIKPGKKSAGENLAIGTAMLLSLVSIYVGWKRLVTPRIRHRKIEISTGNPQLDKELMQVDRQAIDRSTKVLQQFMNLLPLQDKVHSLMWECCDPQSFGESSTSTTTTFSSEEFQTTYALTEEAQKTFELIRNQIEQFIGLCLKFGENRDPLVERWEALKRLKEHDRGRSPALIPTFEREKEAQEILQDARVHVQMAREILQLCDQLESDTKQVERLFKELLPKWKKLIKGKSRISDLFRNITS